MENVNESTMSPEQRRNRRRRRERQELKGLGEAHRKLSWFEKLRKSLTKNEQKALQQKSGIRPKKLELGNDGRPRFIGGAWATNRAIAILGLNKASKP